MTTELVCDADADEALASAVVAGAQINRLYAARLGYVVDAVLEATGDYVDHGIVGAERLVPLGGPGTPEVAEFAPTLLQTELNLTSWQARDLVADAFTIVYRLPLIHEAMAAGHVTVEAARLVARTARWETENVVGVLQHLLLQGDVERPLLNRMPRKRIAELMAQTIAYLDEDEADPSDPDAEAFVSVHHDSGSLASLKALLPVGDAARLDQRLDQIAALLAECGDPRPSGARRATALGLLADPGELERLRARAHAARTGQLALDDDPEPTPATVLYVHIDRDSQTWSADGIGPLTRTEAERIVGHSHVRLAPVLDLDQDLAYTGYVAPLRLREQLRQLNAGQCVFPMCAAPAAAAADYDHRIEYPRGPTTSRNGQLLCRHHHRIKTHTRWTSQNPLPGIWIWTTPDGRRLLVTQGTTTPIT